MNPDLGFFWGGANQDQIHLDPPPCRVQSRDKQRIGRHPAEYRAETSNA